MAGNIDKVRAVAQALGDLKEQVVFVGVAVVELYADNPEVSDIRPTIDVDCVVDMQISTYLDYSNLEEELRKLGFTDDTSENAPICRKIYEGIIVDFIPANTDILGFSNHWYKDGITNKIFTTLPDGTSIYILPVEYFVATKLEALYSRGGKDFRGSKDWEDIVYVLDNCSCFANNFCQCNNGGLTEYLKDKFRNILNNNNIHEIISCALPYNAEEEYIAKIHKLLKDISR
jgi:hypothetical protein